MNQLIMIILNTAMVCGNYIAMLIIFPRKKGLAFTITAFVVYTAVIFSIDYFTEMSRYLAGVKGFLLFPLLAILFRGQLFQKLFAFIMMYLLAMWPLRFGMAVSQIFAPYGSDGYFRLLFCIAMPLYIAYIMLICLFGRKFFGKLFAYGRTVDWMLYTFGVILSFLVMMRLEVLPVPNMPLYLLLMFFILWGFFILCFAIINTHEKTKQKSDAEFARGIISSGRDHYQKMDEMYDKLRALRHDYKYHLSAARKMLSSGDADGTDQYLTVIENQLDEHELQSYCANTVINALIASYAERCAELNIKFDVDISNLKTLVIPNYELCIILGNLLENAVEACEKLENGRKIELATQKNSAQLLFMVKNSFDGKVFCDDGKPVSTKINGGFGLRSVREVIARHGGDLHIEWDKDTFTVYLAVRF